MKLFRVTLSFAALLASPAALSVLNGQCMDFTLPTVPFSRVYYTSAPNASGDRLVVGDTTSSILDLIPVNSAPNQRFCDMQELATGYLADAYVPTVPERFGDFGAFDGLLIDPYANLPFPGGIIPQSRLYQPWAWRIAATSLSFSSVLQPGTTTVVTSQSGTPPPQGFRLGNPPTYYDIESTAVFSGPLTVCLNYSGIKYGNEMNLRLFHFESGAWVDRTVSLDTTMIESVPV